MEATPLRLVLTLLVGVATGVLSAAFGVGGAVVSTPLIRALGVSAVFAIGTTLPSILPSAVSGSLRYAREGLVDWRVVAWTAPPGVLSAVAGAVLSRRVPGEGHVLMLLTAAILGVTALRLARPANADVLDATAPPGRRDRPAVLASLGVAAGLLSGLLGLGGGAVLVPGFTEVVRMRLKQGIASSLVCVGILAVPSTLTHWALRGIDWPTAALLSIGVVPGARLGAAAAVRAREARLRLAIAVFLGVTAAVHATGEVLALVR